MKFLTLLTASLLLVSCNGNDVVKALGEQKLESVQLESIHSKLTAGYAPQVQLFTTSKGEVVDFDTNEHRCDFLGEQKITILEREGDIVTAFEEIKHNRYCEQTEESRVVIKDLNTLKDGLDKFIQEVEKEGVVVTYDGTVLNFLAQGQNYPFDLSKITTYDEFESAMEISSESSNGELIQYTNESYTTKSITDAEFDLDELFANNLVCDYQLDSDPTDDEINYDEICK